MEGMDQVMAACHDNLQEVARAAMNMDDTQLDSLHQESLREEVVDSNNLGAWQATEALLHRASAGCRAIFGELTRSLEGSWLIAVKRLAFTAWSVVAE